MAKAIERIERDIAALQGAIANLAEEFHDTYSRYLSALGQAMRQQLILATYHLCTQGYPEEFIRLSFKQRQNLQQAIRQLADNAKQELISLLHSPTSGGLDPLPTNQPDISDAREEYLDTQLEESLEEQEKVEEWENDTSSSSQSPVPSHQSPIQNPDRLARWQEKMEGAIVITLQKVSRDTNRLLQKTGILSRKLPEPVLEAASKVEAAAETIPGPPNLLNLVIETENDPESQTSTVSNLIAIHLRLAEIEFADSTLTALRHQIRNLSVKLHTTRRDYQKKQREKAVAEAESAWRASWFDD